MLLTLDPDGLLGPPQSGHIARPEKDAKARDEFNCISNVMRTNGERTDVIYVVK